MIDISTWFDANSDISGYIQRKYNDLMEECHKEKEGEKRICRFSIRSHE